MREKKATFSVSGEVLLNLSHVLKEERKLEFHLRRRTTKELNVDAPTSTPTTVPLAPSTQHRN